MNRNEMRGLVVLVCLVVAGVGAKSFVSRRDGGAVWHEVAPASRHSGERPDATQGDAGDTPAAGRLELNSATAAEIQAALPQIGEKRAKAIVAHRQRVGGFRSTSQRAPG